MKKRVLTVLLVLLVVVGAIFAVNAADAQDKAGLTLSANQTEPLSISEDTVLDLNGHDVTAGITVADGANLYIKDSSNGNGKITGTITGNFMSVKNYVPLKINGAYSFRQGDFALENAAYLRTKDIYSEGASVYFKGNIGADNDVIAENVAAHGVAMRLADGEYFADGKAGGETFTSYTGWVSSDDNEINKLNSVELTGIMRRGNSAAINNRNAEYVVYCAPYVEMANGERLLGEEIRCSLKQLIEQVNAGWDNADWVTYDHKATMVTFNQAFPGVLPKWNTIGRINSLIDPVANTQENPFSIQDADDLVLASKASVKNFRLDKDIDMSAVKDWKPFTTFSGTFNGNNKKISNLTITGTSYATSVGFIGINNGTVTNLHLRDVEVIVPSDSVATAVGTIAGTNNGTITGVTATGFVKDTRTTAAYYGALVGNNAATVTSSADIVVNAARVGDDVLQTIAGSDLVDVNEADYTVSGLAADVGLVVEDRTNAGLVGNKNIAENLYWRDRSYSTETQEAELQRRRELVSDYVYELGTLKWTPATKIVYYADQVDDDRMSGGHIHNYTFNPGTTYVGIPYTHCSSSLEQALFYLNDLGDGTYQLKEEITRIKGGSVEKTTWDGMTFDMEEGLSDWKGAASSTTYEIKIGDKVIYSNKYGDPARIGWGKYFGGDCSSVMTVAWHQVSPILTSNRKGNGVAPFYTNNITPSEYNQFAYGIVKVGDYEVDDTWSGLKQENWPQLKVNGKVLYKDAEETTAWANPDLMTGEIVKNIGYEAVYEAYAQTMKGDMLVAYDKIRNSDTTTANDTTKTGHIRLPAQDPVVIRDGKNVIDPEKSFFIVHEQGSGLFNKTTTSSWYINYKFTFKAMSAEGIADKDLAGTTADYNGVGHYLPVTMKAFHDSSIAVTGGAANGTNADDNDPSKSTINSSYRIQSATLVVKDKSGKVMYNKTAFQGASSSQDRRRVNPGYGAMYMSEFFSDYATGGDYPLVANEEYTYTLTFKTFGSNTNDYHDGAEYTVTKDKAFTYAPAETPVA